MQPLQPEYNYIKQLKANVRSLKHKKRQWTPSHQDNDSDQTWANNVVYEMEGQYREETITIPLTYLPLPTTKIIISYNDHQINTKLQKTLQFISTKQQQITYM